MTTWFANPWALWLLASLPALGVLALLANRRRRQALALYRLAPGRPWPAVIRGLLLAVGLTALVLGAAGPQWGREVNLAAPGRDLVVVLDLSRSMLAEQPSRQERAVRALQDLCERVQKRGGHRLALVVFAAHARVACPLTHDYDHFRDALARQDAAQPPPALRPGPDGPPSGTRIGEALSLAVAMQGQTPPGALDVLLVSDGDDPGGDGEWAEGTAEAARRHVAVHTVGVGDPTTPHPVPAGDGVLHFHGEVVRSRLQEGPLQEIARRTGGVYIPGRTGALPLGEWFRTVLEQRRASADAGADVLPALRPRHAWFFAVALLALVGGMLVGDWRGAVRRPCLLPTGPAASPRELV